MMRTRARAAAASLALLMVLYAAVSLRRFEPADAFLVRDFPLLKTEPRVVPPGWLFVPRGLGRVSSYPASPVKLRVTLGGADAAHSREGARVELEADLSVAIASGRVLDLHRARGPAWEAEWLAPLVKRETIARVASVSYDLVRDRDPELAGGLRARIQEQIAGAGLRLESLRLVQTAGLGQSSDTVLQVAGKPVDRDLLILGVDSFDWRLIDPLMKQGRMPNMRRLIDRGTRANLRTIRPILSPVIWTSIATGVKPSRHGIVDFVVTARDTGALVPVTSAMRQVPEIGRASCRERV